MDEIIKYKLWQNDEMVATVEGPKNSAVLLNLAHHLFVYGQNGPVRVEGPIIKRAKTRKIPLTITIHESKL